MHSHIDVQINSQSMVLPEGFFLDVTEENPLFNDNGMYSTPVQVPMEGNRTIFQNLDAPDSDLRPVSMEHLPADIGISGLPFRHGTIVIQEGEELKDAFSFNIDESAQSFSELIGDLKCQDVPLKDSIIIGQKIGTINATVRYDAEVVVGLSNGKYADSGRLKNNTASISFEPQALGFSYPGRCLEGANGVAVTKTIRTYPDGTVVKVPKEVSGRSLSTYINVGEEYGSTVGSPHRDKGGATIGWPYCNTRVCYQHKGINEDGSTSDSVAEPTGAKGMYEDHWPYWVLDADRPTSGICFYVLYFLDCLFAYLGVDFDNSALLAVPDLKRLCFFTTHCRYSTKDADGNTLPLYTLNGLSAINQWLSSRGCGGQLDFEKPEQREFDYYTFTGTFYHPSGYEDSLNNVTFIKGQDSDYGKVTWIKTLPHNDDDSWFSVQSCSAQVVNMYATSENFPDESVKTILDSLEASFGIRFRYDYQTNKVTAYLMRDVFRKKDHNGDTLPVITLPCTVLEVNKLSEKITGVRMKYSAEGEASEQQRNVRTGKRDYDTDFDYIDYPEGRVVVDRQYRDIYLSASGGDMNVYVDLTTGDAFRVKVNPDATTADELKPVWYEVGQFKGIEEGDCSKANEDYVREFVSDFQPVSFNDVNYQNERAGQEFSGTATGINNTSASYTAGSNDTRPILAAYVDEDMEHEFVESRIKTAITPALYNLYVAQVLKLTESYDPSGTDDGSSPLQTYDWGLAVAVMRGGGTNETVQQFDFGYDGFGNDKWRTVSGDYVMASDTMDVMGTEFDYNGDSQGIGDEERFSLKIRAWKPFLYYKDGNDRVHVTTDLSLEGKAVEGVAGKTWLVPCNEDDTNLQGEVARRIRTRGLADRFMAEYIWFLLHRKAYRIHLLAEAAALIDIPNHWHHLFRIGDKTGYIDKLQYTVSAAGGIGEVTVDFYAI